MSQSLVDIAPICREHDSLSESSDWLLSTSASPSQLAGRKGFDWLKQRRTNHGPRIARVMKKSIESHALQVHSYDMAMKRTGN